MYKAIIIDDLTPMREHLKLMLEKVSPKTDVIAESDNLIDGVKLIKKHQPNLVFLDVEMPNHSGLEILDFFTESEVGFHLIFVTAHSTYAINAFELSAIDFLLKPVTPEALQRTFEKIEKSESRKSNLDVLKANLQTFEEQKIVLTSADTVTIVSLSEILYLKADGPYTYFFLKDKTEVSSTKSIAYFEEILPTDVFFRSHRSYIINTKFLKQIDKKQFTLLLANDAEIPLAQTKRNELMEKLNAHT